MDVQKAPRVKCVLGIIYNFKCDIDAFLRFLETVFGKQDYISSVLSFDFTDYYEPEMGKDLKRVFVSYNRLIIPQQLPEIKRLTNIIERNFMDHHKRTINLDPGYLDLDKFVLASAKYARQKIYLDKGIYADPTLYFYKKTFHPYEWSFPDFTTGCYDDFFLKVRQHYKHQLKQ
ncbi:MAG: DUF4416 family protein [Candidatus Marinimicrobia bacterium]|nr:DUF4416 family protein [Candidatus Neomarinimicrobiota bacterium]